VIELLNSSGVPRQLWLHALGLSAIQTSNKAGDTLREQVKRIEGVAAPPVYKVSTFENILAVLRRIDPTPSIANRDYR
jgi:hypothetical protein